MKFYLGTDEPAWLPRTDIPLFISRRRLARRKSLPKAAGRWVLDSGGFTELSMFGRWETSPERYAEEAEQYSHAIGNLDWAAIQDWMCEPFMLAKTDKTIDEHQALTIESYLTLRSLAPQVPWAPVIQGWRPDDYLAHVEKYREAGVDLARLPVVGVGSVCRRQGTREAEEIFGSLASLGIRLHGFGLKVLGMARLAGVLASADSMAWSLRARRSSPLPGCLHRKCSNCMRFALAWREKVIRIAARPQQGTLFV